MSLEAVDIKIVWDRLVSAVNAASRAHQMSAFSTAVTEANDFGCTLLNAKGELVATSDFGLPSFCLMTPVGVQRLIADGVLDQVRDGDVWIHNDPWRAAAQVNDLLVIKPIFRDGVLEGYATSVAHSPDLGGMREWFNTTDVYEEGLLIPPLPLVEAGRRNTTLWKMIEANTRIPAQTIGDLEAQIVSATSIASRTVDILDEHGAVRLADWSAEVIGRCEQLMRAATAAVPDGVYAAEKYLAPWDFGSAEGEPSVTLAVRVVVEGEELTLDFTGTTDQVTRSVNSVAPFTRAYAIYALRLLLTPGIPHNEGFARPAHVVTREGSALAAARPHACLARHVIGHHVPDLVNLALAEALPERARAESGSSPAWTLVLTPLEGRYQNVPRLFGLAGGTGARRESAGQTIMYPVNIGTSSVEMLERTLPIRFVEKSMRPETAGAGRAEGGCGQHVEIDTLGPMIYTFMAGNIRHRPRGLDGGTAGAAGSAEIDKTPISPGSGRVGAGSTFVLQTPGGGGYGAVPDRERAVPGAEDESARAAAGGGRATAPPGDPLRAKVAAGGSRAAPMSSTAGSP